MSTAPVTPIEAILQNRAKLAKLPPEQQQRFADFIFRKFVQPKMDAANVPPEYAARAKKQFTDKLLKGSFEHLDDSPTRDDRKKAGQPVGMMGSLAKGSLEGLANIDAAGAKLSKLPGMGGEQSATALRSSEASIRDAAEAVGSGVKDYEKIHPVKAGAAEMAGQSAPAIPFAMATGGAIGTIGAGALPTAMAEGAVGMQSFEPGLKGAAVGAAAPPILKGAGKVLGKIAAPITRSIGEAAAKRASTAGAKTTVGMGSEAVQALDRHAQADFQKPFVELTSEQKPQILKKFREEAIAKETAARTEKVKAVQTAKIAEREAKEQAKVHTAKATADAKLDSKIARDKLRDEAKQVSQAAAQFRKLMKRAPTEEELGKIREAVKSGQSNAASPAASEEPKVQAAAASAAPEAKAAEAVSLESSRAEAFKAENPEAIKAAEAFTSFAKDPTTGITRVPEGVHGSGFGTNEAALNRVDQVIDKPLAAQKLEAVKADPVGEGLKGKNADRKAVERATAAAQAAIGKTVVGTENEGISTVEKLASSASTPEDKLVAVDKALEYLDANLDNGRLLAKSIKMAAKLKKWSTDETLENTLEIISRLKKEGKLK